MRRIFLVWLALSAVLCAVVAARARLEHPEPVPDAARAWAFAALNAAMTGKPLPEPSAEAKAYRAAGPTIVLAWGRGRLLARQVADEADFSAAVAEAGARLAENAELRAVSGQLVYTITLTGERAPWFRAVPMLAELSVVPFVEGITVSLGEKTVHVTPDEITAAALWDRAVRTPIPDLTFGLSPRAIAKLVKGPLDATEDEILSGARFDRVASLTLTRQPYPSNEQVTIASLRKAAREGAIFLLRHQDEGGRFTYRYDGRRNRPMKGGGYSLPRHAGTAFFLAQAARALDMPSARQGALAALRFVRENVLKRCGSEERACVAFDDRPDMGAAALTALAAAEVLAGGDDPEARELLVRLTAFIRSMQRKDGELMHVYDLAANKPIDVQKMYYSGEAAVALLASHRVLGDERDLEAVRPLMSHLTGAGWSFFGSRYFYGEEHWTCQAVAAAADRMEVGDALDFCLRWLGYQRALLYQPGETPWPVAGAIGVGPVIVPRLTSVASRVEAGAPIYTLAKARGHDVRDLGAQMEAHLGLLMRMRFAPGPTHLMRDPFAARGGFPATQGSLEVRNDFVQHAGSAMLSWADVLERGQ